MEDRAAELRQFISEHGASTLPSVAAQVAAAKAMLAVAETQRLAATIQRLRIARCAAGLF